MKPIVANDVTKRYGETVALDEVSVSIESGDIFALVGPNGAGKTTLVRALTGTISLDGGETRLFGNPPSESRRERIGLLPQSFDPPTRLTPRELLTHYAGLYDVSRNPETILDIVGVTDAAETRYDALSGGQQRRVCVGAALVNDPDVLFLDEPTTGIDPVGQRALWQLIEELATAGATVLLTTHDMTEAESLADVVGFLANGRLITSGPPSELVAEYGGSPRLIVETQSEPPTPSSLSYPVEFQDGQLVIRSVAPAAIGDVVKTLADHDIEYTSLSWQQPDLATAYLALTDNANVTKSAAMSRDDTRMVHQQ